MIIEKELREEVGRAIDMIMGEHQYDGVNLLYEIAGRPRPDADKCRRCNGTRHLWPTSEPCPDCNPRITSRPLTYDERREMFGQTRGGS